MSAPCISSNWSPFSPGYPVKIMVRFRALVRGDWEVKLMQKFGCIEAVLAATGVCFVPDFR